jgi:hypothetical protein
MDQAERKQLEQLVKYLMLLKKVQVLNACFISDFADILSGEMFPHEIRETLSGCDRGLRVLADMCRRLGLQDGDDHQKDSVRTFIYWHYKLKKDLQWRIAAMRKGEEFNFNARYIYDDLQQMRYSLESVYDKFR